jgi:opacity protein-like surface antigen
LSKRTLSLLVFCGLGIATAAAQNFNRFTVNVGGGFGAGLGDAGKFTHTSFHGVAGAGVNFSRMFGIKAEYMYYNLALKDSVIQQQFLLPGAHGNLQSATLNGVFNFPWQGRWGFYGIAGAGGYQRTVEERSRVLQTGAVCQPIWILWWGITCVNNQVATEQTLSSHTVGAAGYNFGGGVTYRFSHRAKLYVEGRYHRANTSRSPTKVFPVTVGLRW